MEHYDPSRRQYAPTSYPAQQPQQTAPQTAGSYGTPGSAERFRQTNYMQQSPTAAQSSSRASHDAQQLYNFSQGVQYATGSSLPATQMQYSQDYSPQEPRQQTQQYQQYGTGAVYGGSIQQGQQQVQSAYDQVPNFRQSRTGAAPETLPSQFGEAPTAQYYLAGQTVPSSAPPTEMAAPQLPSQYSQSAYAQSGSSAQQSYGMLDPAQSAAYSTYSQQSQYAAPQSQQPSESVDQLFNQYQISIRTIFTRTREGDLRDTPDQLIRISQYLLGRAEALGLTRDDEALHDDRIRLWDEFNRAWLATLQCQHDMTQEMLRGQALHESQSIINTQALEQLARELVRLCDEVEKHGLVDYQMGVAEEEIMNLLLRCLALLDAPNDRPEDSASRPESSSAAPARSR